MKITLVLLLFAGSAFGNVIERWTTTGCNADDCLRAVTGTRNGIASEIAHQTDCSIFMTTSVGR